MKNLLKPNREKIGLRGGVKGGWGGGGGVGEVSAPPLCNITQMTLMQVVHTETYLHRWEPLLNTLIKRELSSG